MLFFKGGAAVLKICSFFFYFYKGQNSQVYPFMYHVKEVKPTFE